MCIKYFLFLNKIFLLIKKRKRKRFKDMNLSEREFFDPILVTSKSFKIFLFGIMYHSFIGILWYFQLYIIISLSININELKKNIYIFCLNFFPSGY